MNVETVLIQREGWLSWFSRAIRFESVQERIRRCFPVLSSARGRQEEVEDEANDKYGYYDKGPVQSYFA